MPEKTETYNSVDASVTVQIRLVAVETGKVVFSDSFKKGIGLFSGWNAENKAPESLIAGYIQKICEKDIPSKIASTLPWRGYVVSVDGKEVIIDLGEDVGIAPKMKFKVIDEQEKINPRTKEKIIIQRDVGLIEITRVTNTSAMTKVLKGYKDIKEGMVAVSREK